MNVNSDCEVIDIKQIYFIFILVKNWSSLHVHDWFEAVFISHEKYDTKIKKEI